ncbi:hypothetical protein [Helicobacter bizzozeronii]|uniref:hypothetical protein n=1 Tax=Helicobacter bizzozeronii TaxID=56877 RepID=UPI000CEDC3FA|nr:hypothetical protein [Helicobacter bizzozeronii]
MQYAYMFVLLDDRVCVFRYTDKGIVSLNRQKARFEDIEPNFWEAFEEHYNIDPNAPKDYAFAWINKVGKHTIVLNSPHFKERLDKSVWNATSARAVLDLLNMDCHLRCSMEDFAGNKLEDGNLWLSTNVDLSKQHAPQVRLEEPKEEPKDLSGIQRFHQENLKPYEDALKGKRTPKPEAPVQEARRTDRKFSTQGDTKPHGLEDNQ